MRLYKSRAEQTCCGAPPRSPWAHIAAPCAARQAHELRVMAELLHEFRSHNADISLLPHRRQRRLPASCTTATMINPWRRNLLLLDAGCEHEFYASTSHVPFDRRPVHVGATCGLRHRAEAQLAAIDKVRSETIGIIRTRRRYV
jgi:hypothetical protein